MTEIICDDVTLEITDHGHCVNISIDDPNTLCMRNDYNGDFAQINLNPYCVRQLHAALTEIVGRLPNE